ncbi:nucleotide exchange factor GrpE [Halobaculum sp. D14]|uniref:nucleotide exchange factor GrpE n=1 Tax=unclassified Halobaculum TaxID=2640896 RepID=UPI003EBCC471
MSEEAEADPAEQASDEQRDGASGEPAADAEPALADRVADYDEALARDVAEMERRAAEAEARVEELKSSLSRTKADFENYKKRAKKRQEQQKARATEDLVTRLTEVRDNLVRALDQDEDADIRPGVESTLESFDRVFDEEGVSVIDPDLGDEVDPQRHEVLMRVDADQPADTIAEVYKPGYEMAGKVIEAAQVTVSDGDS